MSKLIGSLVVAAALVVPACALAQTSTTGLLTVYVQVINQTGYTYQPSNFTVTVIGNNPSPATFAGSNQGTKVSLGAGSYSVSINNPNGYFSNPTYSQGCTASIATGESQTCVVTVNAGNYWGYPSVTPYPYPYNYLPSLTCRTETPTVGLGQTARFVAVGGVGGTYNWSTPFQNYPNIGTTLTATFNSSGTHAVTVTNASQTATCTVIVTNSYYPQPTLPPAPTYTYPGTPSYVYPYGTPTLTSYAQPRFPNTGFEPITSAQLAFAVVLLMGAGILAYPHARKAFALAVR